MRVYDREGSADARCSHGGGAVFIPSLDDFDTSLLRKVWTRRGMSS